MLGLQLNRVSECGPRLIRRPSYTLYIIMYTMYFAGKIVTVLRKFRDFYDNIEAWKATYDDEMFVLGYGIWFFYDPFLVYKFCFAYPS